jgi:hypothetical protein
MIVWKNRHPATVSWKENGRDKYKTKGRDYSLGSFFSTVLTAITDPKDNKGIKIKCDPAYLTESKWKSRTEGN